MQASGSSKHIIDLDNNAWRSDAAKKLGFIVDGADYYLAIKDVLPKAEKSIWIIGWDFDPDIRLDPRNSNETLGAFLFSLAEAKPDLEIRILIWAMAASLENPYWRDVLKWGHNSRFAPFFDNDWNQKLTLPVLGERLEDVIEAGDGKLSWQRQTSEIVFDYHGGHYPLAPSTYLLALEPDARPKELAELSAQASPEKSVALGDYLRSHLERDAGRGLISNTSDIAALLKEQPWRMTPARPERRPATA